jgi:hypothetical protein
MKGLKMKKIAKQARQGDVLLTPVDSLPGGVKPLKHARKIVLAEGEATGHEHAIRAKASQIKQYVKDTELYLEVQFPVTLEHEEHASIIVEPGIYQVRRQVEQWMDEVHRVAD